MSERAADVVIVGAGYMGAASAFFLRKRGRSVVLIEQDMVGRHASGTNFGNVRRQGRAFEQLPLANRAREIWGDLPRLLGEDCEFLPCGHLRVSYTAEKADEMAAYADGARGHGLDLEILSQNRLRDRFPFLGSRVVAGSYSPLDGHANPRLAAPAFARAARREGAQVFENTRVLSVEKAGEDFRVETDSQGRFRAPVVLIAAGAWGGRLSAAFGEPVPLVVRGPQMSVTEPVPYALRGSYGVSTNVAGEAIYFRQIERGNVVVGGPVYGTASIETRRAQVDPRIILAQIEQLKQLAPALGRLRVIRTWSGVESYLPDQNPAMGESAKVAGLYYAFGFSGQGFQLGPGVGDVMAELIDTGRSTVPIAPFHIRRFAGPGAPAWPGAAPADSSPLRA